MIAIEPFRAGDLAELVLQPVQHAEAIGDRPETAAQLEAAGPAFTVRATDGRVLMCGGLIEVHPHYATAWARLALGKRAAMMPLTRATARVLAEARYARIDTSVRWGFAAGHSWATLIGLRHEATLRRWGPDGADYCVYARIREDI